MIVVAIAHIALVTPAPTAAPTVEVDSESSETDWFIWAALGLGGAAVVGAVVGVVICCRKEGKCIDWNTSCNWIYAHTDKDWAKGDEEYTYASRSAERARNSAASRDPTDDELCSFCDRNMSSCSCVHDGLHHEPEDDRGWLDRDADSDDDDMAAVELQELNLCPECDMSRRRCHCDKRRCTPMFGNSHRLQA